MSRLNWGALGERSFEAGVDRGVLYVDVASGVAWNGLIAVSESPTGGDPRPFYIDGVKFRNLAAREEFEATIEAFSSPKEFGPCDGTASVHNGLFATQQPRRAFNLSYRTMVGNDVDGEAGYKIHLVYNALASPSERKNSTITNSPSPTSFSWQISTLPPALTGFKPTAHFVIDSRYLPPFLLQKVEDVLYGSDQAGARLPAPPELVTLFDPSPYPPIKIVAIDNGAYELYEVDIAQSRTVMQNTAPPAPLANEAPIFWLDTSQGNYAIPKLVTGD